MNDEMTARSDETAIRSNEQRTPELIGAEIRMWTNTGRQLSLMCGIEIGRRLSEAKEMLNHGEWLPWLERETEFSSSSAQRYMKLFDEYGASQLGLFGPETNTPTLGNLPISKALALLSVPESDRIEFAEEVDAEHISVRELEQKIKERERQLEALRKDMDGNQAALADAKKRAQSAEERLRTQDEMLTEAKAKIAELAKLNDELEHRPVEVAVETVRDEEAITAAAKEAREQAEAEKREAVAEYEKTVNDLNGKLLAAEKERDRLKKKAATADAAAEDKLAEAARETDRIRAELEKARADQEELRKQLKTSETDVAEFSVRFNTVQSDFKLLMEAGAKVMDRDRETGAKLATAVRNLLEHFLKQLEDV